MKKAGVLATLAAVSAIALAGCSSEPEPGGMQDGVPYEMRMTEQEAAKNPFIIQVNEAFLEAVDGNYTNRVTLTSPDGQVKTAEFTKIGEYARYFDDAAENSAVYVTDGKLSCVRDVTEELPNTTEADKQASWSCKEGRDDFAESEENKVTATSPLAVLSSLEPGTVIVATGKEEPLSLLASLETKDGVRGAKLQYEVTPGGVTFSDVWPTGYKVELQITTPDSGYLTDLSNFAPTETGPKIPEPTVTPVPSNGAETPDANQ